MVQKWKLLIQTLNKKWKKKEQDSIDADEEKDEARNDNSLMKKVQIKNEFLEEEQKL